MPVNLIDSVDRNRLKSILPEPGPLLFEAHSEIVSPDSRVFSFPEVLCLPEEERGYSPEL